MSANTCATCNGVGSVKSGRFEPCHACGGKGHGLDANVRCTECKGSGDSAIEIMELCTHCHGTGHDYKTAATDAESYDTTPAAIPAASASAATAPSRNKAPSKEPADAVARRVLGSIATIAGIMLGVYGYFWLSWRVESSVGLGLTALLASYFALTIVYLLLKVVLKGVKYTLFFTAWLLVMTLVARFLGYRWPLEIQEFLVRLLDNIGLL
jgi:hypothetical protein